MCNATFFQVKRLHDAFHEPFRRAVPNPAAPVAENPAGVAPENERNEGVEQNQETSKQRKKEEVSVKSALKAAFAKYSGTIGSKRKAVVPAEREENVADAQQAAGSSEGITRESSS